MILVCQSFILSLMFLGVDKLLLLVASQKLVEGLCQRELTNPEGCGFDLRLGKVWKIKGSGFLGVEDRKTCDTVAVKARHLIIKPGDFYLVTTIETVNVPKNLVGILKPRSTLQRMGLILRTTQIAPGYSGELTFALYNAGPCQVKIEFGARIVHVMFARVEGKTALYRGQWQGGRVTTKKKERQI